MSRLKFYYDLLSQPSRSLLIFLQTNKIPFEPVPIRLGKGEHKTEEFKKITPLQLVPVIDDDGFVVKESVGILRYLSKRYNVDDHWYPNDVKEQAKVDEYLEWQHLGTRFACGMYFRIMWLTPMATKVAPNSKLAEKHKELMVNTCNTVQDVWLGDKKYICGDKISIADLLAVSELEQPRLAGYDPREGRPKLAEYMERVRQDTNPSYDVAHKVLNTIVEKFKGECPALVKSAQN
ncbi:glutathione S-transferase theta-1-like [Cimex lectularius]|uniref:glutathione transferase n=1 Tax=Cimex lectularius TaxID=79782 RepID=A0A8I6SDG5_CIMLE|nr:glutathione S-transferase theta-1-like [Cimex lectularius]